MKANDLVSERLPASVVLLFLKFLKGLVVLRVRLLLLAACAFRVSRLGRACHAWPGRGGCTVLSKLCFDPVLAQESLAAGTWDMQLVLHVTSRHLLVVWLIGRACASCLRTRSVPWLCRGPARRLSLWEAARCGSGCAWALLCWSSSCCAGMLCVVVVCAVCVALGLRLGSWLACTWADMALAGGCCGRGWCRPSLGRPAR